MNPRMPCRAAAALAAVLAAGAVAAAPPPPPSLRAEGCTGCHAERTKRIGPPWEWIAYRYRGVPAARARAQVAKFIVSGGSGYWSPWTGGLAMPPYPGIGPQQARELAQWILTRAPLAPPAR